MRIRELFRLKPARSQPMLSDWTTGWSTREWADLPTHHPRRDKDVRG